MSQPPLGPVRCPACGQKALPAARCLYCNARLNEAVLVEPVADDAIPVAPLADEAIQATPTIPLRSTEGKCPSCDKALSAGAVLCIDCGYDLRTGRKRRRFTLTSRRSRHRRPTPQAEST